MEQGIVVGVGSFKVISGKLKALTGVYQIGIREMRVGLNQSLMRDVIISGNFPKVVSPLDGIGGAHGLLPRSVAGYVIGITRRPTRPSLVREENANGLVEAN